VILLAKIRGSIKFRLAKAIRSLDFRRYWIRGTDSRRETYATLKRLLNHKNSFARQSLARDCAGGLSFNIPPDQGFKVFPPKQFAEVVEVVQSTQDLIAKVKPDKLEWRKKQQLLTGILDVSELTLESPYLRFALHPDILASVSAYLGVVPLLTSANVWYSRYQSGAFANSQLYHCDWDDNSQIKIFIYSSEVEVNSGPLVVMNAGTSKLVREKLRYTYGGTRYRVTGEEIKLAVCERSTLVS